MRQLWITGIALALLSTSALAADAPAAPDTAPAPQAGSVHHHHWAGSPKTRQEAIAREQKRLDKLKSMTDEQWQKQHEARQAHYRSRHHHGELAPSAGSTPPNQ